MQPDNNVSAGTYAHECFRVYSHEVLTNRALPNAFDGLKPVQRRILAACDHLGLKPTASYVKSIKVVGTALAMYHPHADAACYSALVNVTGSAMMNGMPINRANVPLMEGQGNFGDHENPPAALRYTECRPSNYAYHFLLNRSYLAVTPKVRTETGDGDEPAYLPALLPNLLLNGADGRAVALVTNIPSFEPESVRKLVDAAFAACKGNELPSLEKTAQLMEKHLVYQYCFGGFAINPIPASDYLENSFAIDVLPKVTIEKTALVVTSIHHQKFNPANWLEKAAAIDGTKSARDETGQHGLRFVVAHDPKNGRSFDEWAKAVLASLRSRVHFKINAVVGYGDEAEVRMLSVAGLLHHWMEQRLELEASVIRSYVESADKEELHLLAVKFAIRDRDLFFPLLESDEVEAALHDFYAEAFGPEEPQENIDEAVRYILSVSLRTLTKASVSDLDDRLAKVAAALDAYDTDLTEIVKATRRSTTAALKGVKHWY